MAKLLSLKSGIALLILITGLKRNWLLKIYFRKPLSCQRHTVLHNFHAVSKWQHSSCIAYIVCFSPQQRVISKFITFTSNFSELCYNQKTSSYFFAIMYSIKQNPRFVVAMCMIWAYTEDNIKFYEINDNYFLKLDSHSRLLELTLQCDTFQKHEKYIQSTRSSSFASLYDLHGQI